MFTASGNEQNGKKRRQDQIKGIITYAPEVRIGKSSGKPWAKFIVRLEDGSMRTCLCFGETAESAGRDLEKGIDVSLIGYFKDHEAQINKELTVTAYSTPQKALSHREQAVREYGGEKGYKEHLRKRWKTLWESGYVPALYRDDEERIRVQWVKREECISFGKKWARKVDYVLEVLGGEETTARYKECFSTFLPGSFNTKLYETFLDELVEIARERAGDGEVFKKEPRPERVESRLERTEEGSSHPEGVEDLLF